MTRQQEITQGLERLEDRKGPWQQSKNQKAPGAMHRWWTELLARQPQLARVKDINALDREYICEQVRRDKPSGHRGRLGRG